MMNDLFLETDRLLLRRLRDSDLADYALYAADDEMSRMMGRAFLHTEADIRQNFTYLKDKAPRCYGLIDKAGGHLIGNLSIEPLPQPLQKLDILRGKTGPALSFCIRREFQRKGLMLEAVQAVVNHLFCVKHFDFVQCGCFDFNTASVNLQRKLGFQPLTQLHLSTPQGEVTTIESILWNPKEVSVMDLNVYFKSVIDQDTASVVLCDLNHTILYMNPAAIRNYAKRGGAQLIGRSLLNCHNPNSNSRIQEVVDWFAKSPEHNIIYTSHNDKQNKDVYMVALRDADGTLVGYYEKHEFRNPETMPRYDFTE